MKKTVIVLTILLLLLTGCGLFACDEAQDEGSISSEEPLSVEETVCSHKHTDFRSYREATCTEEGYSGDKYCADCGVCLLRGVATPLKSHLFTVRGDAEALPALCVRNRFCYYECSECGAIGEETYEVFGTATGICSYTAESDAVASLATCSKNQRNYYACPVCGDVSGKTYEVEGTATGKHDFSAPSTLIAKEATCNGNELHFYACSVCGLVSDDYRYTYEVEGTATGKHDYSAVSDVIAKIADCGRNEYRYYACVDCGRVLYSETRLAEIDGTLTSLHDFTKASGQCAADATCVSNRREYAACAVCGAVDTGRTVEIPNTYTGVHLFTEASDRIAVQPSCRSCQYNYYKCRYCDAVSAQKTYRLLGTETPCHYEKYVCVDCGRYNPEYYIGYDVPRNENTDVIRVNLYRNEEDISKYDVLVYGSGRMAEYEDEEDAPWKAYRANFVHLYTYGTASGSVTIGGYALKDAVNLKTADLSAASSVGAFALDGCTALNTVTVGSKLTYIGIAAFAHCSALLGADLSGCTALTKIETGAFRKDTSLAEIRLAGSGVTEIGDGAFAECSGIESVSLPSGLATVGAYAFYRTPAVTSGTELVLPASVQTVGEYAFAEDGAVTAVRFSGDVALKEGAFNRCSRLASAVIDTRLTAIGKNVFSETDFYSQSDNWTDSILYLDSGKKYLLCGLNASYFAKIVPAYGSNPKEDGLFERIDGAYVRTEIMYADGIAEYYREIPAADGVAVLPVATEIIADGAFYGCTELEGVVLNTGVKTVGKEAFYSCGSLQSLSFLQPSSLQTVGSAAFYGCAQLFRVELPDSVTSVGDEAFAYCTQIRSFRFGTGLTAAKVGQNVLYGDSVFEIYTVDAALASDAVVRRVGAEAMSVTSVIEQSGDFIFAEYDEKAYLVGCLNADGIELTLPSSVSLSATNYTSYEIYNRAFYMNRYYAQAVTVHIPKAVTAIGEEAFAQCASLSNIVIADSGVVHIGKDAFIGTAFANNENNYTDNCLYLSFSVVGGGGLTSSGKYLLKAEPSVGVQMTKLSVTDGTELIADGALEKCTDLQELSLPASVVYIGSNLLSACRQMTTLTVPFIGAAKGEKEYIAYFFGGSGADDNKTVLPKTLTSLTVTSYDTLPASCLKECQYLTKINLSAKVVKIGASALRDTVRATIAADGKLQSVGAYAFSGCIGLTEVQFASSLTEIGEGAFEDTGLSTIDMTDSGIVTIGANAFSRCYSLYYAEFGSALATVGAEAFSDCVGLTRAVLNSKPSFGTNAFYGCRKLIEIRNNAKMSLSLGVTDNGYLTYYAKKIYVNDETQIETNGDFLMAHIGSAYYLLGYIGSSARISLPTQYREATETLQAVTEYQIYQYAFAQNQSLVAVTVPKAVTAVREGAFLHCTKLTSVTMEGSQTAGVITIGEKAFAESGLQSVVFPISVTQIGKEAFRDCSDLKTVTFIDPEAAASRVSSVGEGAFRNCTSIKILLFPSSLTTVGADAFNGCTALERLEASSNLTTVGNAAFANCTALGNLSWCSAVTLTVDSEIFFGSGRPSGMTVTFTEEADVVPAYFFHTKSADNAPKISTVNLGVNIVYIKKYAFFNLGVSSVTMPKNLVKIEERAFANSKIISFAMPDTVYNWEASAFQGCKALKTVTLSSLVDSIPDYSFDGCVLLTALYVPSRITTIGKRAFYGCEALKMIAVSDGLTEIGENAFTDCGLKKVIVYGANTLSASVNTGNNIFSDAEKCYYYFAEKEKNIAKNASAVNALYRKENSSEPTEYIDTKAVSYTSSDTELMDVGVLSGMVDVKKESGSAYVIAKINITDTFSVTLSYKVTATAK